MDKAAKVLGRVIKRYFSDGVARASAQLAYYLFFSIFPVLILVNNIISRLNVDIKSILLRFEYLFPAQIADMLIDYIDYLRRIESPYMFVVSVFLTLYAMTRSLNSLLTSVRQAYRIKKAGTVNYMTAALLSAIILLSFFMLTAVILGGEFVIVKLEKYINVPLSVNAFLRLLKFVLLPVYMFFILSGFYYIVPSRRYSFKYAIPGAMFAVVTITTVTTVFSYYVSHFSNYSLLYGSLAAVMILMIWLQLVSSVLILGGELNDVLIEFNRD
ncbi:MAG: YihY/virulence factor BrkB family protein [Clostridiaceae bacterium]|nr:YihY/virulence factor BrkB family protein [Clostridiaceae bacterium]